MTGQTCALPGCFKPPWRSTSVRPGSAPPLACGNLHHQLLMASCCNPDPYLALLHRNNDGFCALPSCAKLLLEGHSWCSRSHYEEWLTEFTSSLHPEYQICMLPGCTRHVYVDNNGPPSRFCGWRHKQEFVRVSALQRRQQEPPRSSVFVLPPQPPPPLPASMNESEDGHVPSLNSQLSSLIQLAHVLGSPTKNISVIEDFFEKHPSEVLTEGHACCWLIAHPKSTSKGRQLTTKGHYHWKQSGQQVKERKYAKKYYTYTKMKGKKKEADQQHVETSYTMREYTVEDIESHSLISVKKKPFSKGKVGKEQPSKHQITDQVDNAHSEDARALFINDFTLLVDDAFCIDMIDQQHELLQGRHHILS